VAILIGGYFALKTFGEAFGSDCDESKSWTVQEYTIQEYSCLGFAGPKYYPLDLYKNGKEIANNGFRKDSCIIKFNPKNDLYLYLNICDNSIKEIRPEKKQLYIESIDSIQIFSKKLNKTKKLTEKQKNRIVNDWNKSEVLDYREKAYDSIFYPDFSYKIYVYDKQNRTEYITGNYLMSNKTKWTYIMSTKRNTEYFDEIWNEE
jgi:hypothetical protein